MSVWLKSFGLAVLLVGALMLAIIGIEFIVGLFSALISIFGLNGDAIAVCIFAAMLVVFFAFVIRNIVFDG